jgi:hypothetical protein
MAVVGISSGWWWGQTGCGVWLTYTSSLARRTVSYRVRRLQTARNRGNITRLVVRDLLCDETLHTVLL